MQNSIYAANIKVFLSNLVLSVVVSKS